jgi:hypothetical protein
MSINCGGQTVEIVGTDKVKINGTHEYTMNPDKNILDVTRDIIQIVQAKPDGNSGWLKVLMPEAKAQWFQQNWQGLAVGAAAVGLLWLLFGNKKKDKQANVTTTTTNNYYYGYGGGPMPMMAKPGSKSLNKPHTSR